MIGLETADEKARGERAEREANAKVVRYWIGEICVDGMRDILVSRNLGAVATQCVVKLLEREASEDETHPFRRIASYASTHEYSLEGIVDEARLGLPTDEIAL